VTLVKGDITLLKVDAIVNAANSGLMGGGGVDGAIHRAGGPAIDDECRVIVSKIGRLPAGQAVITTGGRLPSKYVIHTVGPVWRGGGSREEDVLASCYTESLKIAGGKEPSSIAFPAISTGIYGYPQELAAGVAVNAVISYLKSNRTTLKLVQFVVYDSNALKIYTSMLNSVVT
jgi:O-acetyl-ADP-ribose deacetylase (regulator of RNase III)